MPAFEITFTPETAAVADTPEKLVVEFTGTDPLDETLILLASATAQLTDQQAAWTSESLAAKLGRGKVGGRVRRAVKEGWHHAGYRTRRDAYCAVAAAGHQMGAPAGFLLQTLLHPQAQFCTIAPDEELAATIEDRVRRQLQHNDNERSAAVRRAATWARTTPIDCRRPATGRTLLETLVKLAARSSRLTATNGTPALHVAASLRQIAAEANLHPATARRVLHELCASDTVRLVEQGNHRNAAVWELKAPTGTAETNARNKSVWDDLGCDAAHAKGLGKTLTLTLREMRPGVGHSSADLAEKLGTSKSAMRIRLNKLAKLGLVERRSRTWYSTAQTPSVVSDELGTTGARARRRVAYEEERRTRASQKFGHAV